MQTEISNLNDFVPFNEIVVNESFKFNIKKSIFKDKSKNKSKGL